MKKGFTLVAILALSALIYQSCDYVSHAVPTATPNSTSTTTTGTSAVVYRKVLIEDYTGHKCGNCPAAARQLRKLDSLNAGKIVPIAVHAGFYANVTPSTNPPYPTDLRSQAGTDYDTYFGNSAAGNPNGLVNRVGYGSANFIKQWGDWGTFVAMDTLLADFKITIANTYNSSSNQVSTTVTTKAINSKTGTYNLTIVLTEDSIIAEQIDYSITSGSQYITNYVFNHVLRGALNTSWGAPIITGSINAGDSIKTTISNYQLGSTWNWKHCHIVAYIYDAASGSSTQYEVLQVEEKDLQ